MVQWIIDIHQIFFVLGTPSGELVKILFEFFIYTLITYMVLSEYTRDPTKELRYLASAFGALSFHKLVSGVVLTSVLFGSLGMTTYRSYYSVIDNSLEVFALILLSNAFLFRTALQEKRPVTGAIKSQGIILFSVFIIIQLSALFEILFIDNNASTSNYIAGIIFNLMKLTLLAYPILILVMRGRRSYHLRNTVLAFSVYLVGVLFESVNILFFDHRNASLLVAEQPFPLAAVILFTRVIYLKLVDKAYLKKQLVHEKELGRLKDKFVSTVSHELKTPLTSINLYTGLLREGHFGKTGWKQKEALGVIKEETKRLNELITDVLDLSKLEQKKEKLNLGNFAVHEFVTNNICRSLAGSKGIKIINRVDKSLMLRVDEAKFKQVIINLLSNAIKFTDSGGIVTVSSEKHEKWATIIVEDTGRGIRKEDLLKIFDKFYQAEHYMTRKEKGTGLGLAIANEIVKLHGGRIDVESELGKGSRFRVVVPS